MATPFDELTATRGVGQKKISSLVKLLQRATSNDPPAVPFGLDDPSVVADSRPADPVVRPDQQERDFDPAIVSEVLWDRWRDLLTQRRVGHEKLGRLARTLQGLPTVIWHTPLGHYLAQSLAEIRGLRTHGEKRVAVVLEIVHSVYDAYAGSAEHEYLATRVLPRFIPPIENWIADARTRANKLSYEEIRRCLAIPLLDHLRIDAGETVYGLCRGGWESMASRKAYARRRERSGLHVRVCINCWRNVAV